MRDKRLFDVLWLLSLIGIVLIRRNFGGPAYFPGEVLIEDLILILAVALVWLPVKFGRLISSLVSFSMSIVLLLMAVSPRSHRRLLAGAIFFVLLGIYAAAKATIEAARLWRDRNGLQ